MNLCTLLPRFVVYQIYYNGVIWIVQALSLGKPAFRVNAHGRASSRSLSVSCLPRQLITAGCMFKIRRHVFPTSHASEQHLLQPMTTAATIVSILRLSANHDVKYLFLSLRVECFREAFTSIPGSA